MDLNIVPPESQWAVAIIYYKAEWKAEESLQAVLITIQNDDVIYIYVGNVICPSDRRRYGNSR